MECTVSQKYEAPFGYNTACTVFAYDRAVGPKTRKGLHMAPKKQTRKSFSKSKSLYWEVSVFRSGPNGQQPDCSLHLGIKNPQILLAQVESADSHLAHQTTITISVWLSD